METQREVGLRNAAYTGFTAGSTGKPKIFVLEHLSVGQVLQALYSLIPVKPQSHLLQFAGYTFDISIMDHLAALVSGACLCVPSEWERRNSLADAMCRYQVDYACLTTSVLRTLRSADVPCVKTVVQIREAKASDVVDRWSHMCQLINAYGPAECALACSVQDRLGPGAEATNIETCITGALPVVDRDDYQCLLPIGAVGELVVEGPQVGRAYMGDPEKTAAAMKKWLRVVVSYSTDTFIAADALHWWPRILRPVLTRVLRLSGPDTFDPYRFLTLRQTAPDKETYAQATTPSPDHMGWGLGKHACPGRNLVLTEIKIALCHIPLKYEFQLPGDVRPRPSLFGIFFASDASADVTVRRRKDSYPWLS